MFESLTVPSIAPCPVGKVLDDIDKESRSHLIEALELSNSDVSNARIALAIREEFGKGIDPNTVSVHRKGQCRCSRI
jgi:hypothetical protein